MKNRHPRLLLSNTVAMSVAARITELAHDLPCTDPNQEAEEHEQDVTELAETLEFLTSDGNPLADGFASAWVKINDEQLSDPSRPKRVSITRLCCRLQSEDLPVNTPDDGLAERDPVHLAEDLVHRLIRSIHEDRKFANVFKLLESDWVNHPSVSVH